MAAASRLSHPERTAAEPRAVEIHQVVLHEHDNVNEDVQIVRLRIPEGNTVEFKPGQWLDVHIPGLSGAGGFTITSTPNLAIGSPGKDGILELAVQWAPQNVHAMYLWQHHSVSLSAKLLVRAGGSFIWPPPNVDLRSIKKVIFVAGGVGINPLMSILSCLHGDLPDPPISIQFLYTSKIPRDGLDSILFLPRLKKIFASSASLDWSLCCFLTGIFSSSNPQSTTEGIKSIQPRRINHEDLIQALGPVSKRNGVVAYVCGPTAMTNEFLQVLRIQGGMEAEMVLCEKW